MKISSYQSSLNRLANRVKDTPTRQPSFKTASIMPYASEAKVTTRALNLIDQLSAIGRTRQNPELFFNPGQVVPIPDIHGDFERLIVTLHKHGLLDKELNLKKEYKYVILGDVYDRGENADVVDYWLNKQISRGIEIYRIAGDHEINFFTNRFSCLEPCNDLIKDNMQGYNLTEDLLRGIASGEILAACLFYDENTGIPIIYSHSYFVQQDFEQAHISIGNPESFVSAVNKRLKDASSKALKWFNRSIKDIDLNGNPLARISPEERLTACLFYDEDILDATKGRTFNEIKVGEPFVKDPLFDMTKIGYLYEEGFKTREITEIISDFEVKSQLQGTTRRSFMMRRPWKIMTEYNKKPRKTIDDLPEGTYQIVGHTPVKYLAGATLSRPFIVSGRYGSAFVQFSDIGFGYGNSSNSTRELVSKTKFVLNSTQATSH